MQIKKRVNKQSVQIGTSSLLLIFTVLCLVVFSTLSLASAKSDYRLAKKNEQSVKAYYAVDAKGEELKKDINEQIIKLLSQATSSESFKELIKQNFKESFDENNNVISYTLDASDEQFLLIELQVSDYEDIAVEKQNYKVVSWIICNKVDYDVDDSMPVWDGI